MSDVASKADPLLERILSEEGNLFAHAMRLVVSNGKHREDAQDLVQDTLLRAWKAVSTGNGPQHEEVERWLHLTLKNAFLDSRKSKKPLDGNAETFAFSYENLPEDYSDLFTAQCFDADGKPDEDIILARAAARIEKPENRLIFLLRAQNLKYSEIAQQTGLSEEIVKKRLFRIREVLRPLWPEITAPTL